MKDVSLSAGAASGYGHATDTSFVRADSSEGRQYARLLETMRELQDSWTLSDPSSEVMEAAMDRIDEVIGLLNGCRVSESQTPNGKRPDLPGRGSLLLVPAVIDYWSPERLTGHVTFRDYHRGGRSDAAHGGTHALLFDEVIGKLVNDGNRPITRTAFLHVDYRAIVPVGIELDFDATVDRQEGRKVFASGRITRGGTVLAEASGLWVALRSGQP